MGGAKRLFIVCRGRVAAISHWLASDWLLLALPFAMLSWLLPFVSARTIGNDYGAYSPYAQLDLMWSSWRGTFPLYMPGFAGGHSTAAMTLGQLYHPLSWLSSLMPGYRNGLALEWNTFFRLLSLGAAQLALFRLCRRLCIPAAAAFLVTFPAVYNLRMLDSFRYGASLESYVGMLLATSALGMVYLGRHPRKSLLFLAAATYLLSVGGHPQWTFFGLLIVGLEALLMPWLLAAMGEAPPRTRARLIEYGKRVVLGVGTGVLFAAPYLFTFYFEYLVGNRARAEPRYKWTLGAGDSFQGELANFFYPLHSNVHGSFGGSALFALAFALPAALVTRRRPPGVLWVLYGVSVLGFLFAIGKASPAHAFMVRYVPLFSTFRAPGRILMWLPVVALPLLAWLLRRENRAALLAVASSAVALLAAYVLRRAALLPRREHLTPHRILGPEIPPYADDWIVYAAVASLLLLLAAGLFTRASRWLICASWLPVVGSTWLCLAHGTWKTEKANMPTFAELTLARRTSADSQAPPGYGMETRAVTAYAAHRLSPSRELGTVVHDVVELSPGENVFKRLKSAVRKAKRRGVPSKTLFVAQTLGAPTREVSEQKDRVDLRYNTSNRFKFDVVAGGDGYFVLGQAWVPGFEARVDQRPVPTTLANGLFPAVFVPRGTHRVEFRFFSRPFLAGAFVVFATATAWLWCFSLKSGWCRLPRRKLWLAAATAGSAAALVALLNFTLYHGPTFGTAYRWESSAE